MNSLEKICENIKETLRLFSWYVAIGIDEATNSILVYVTNVKDAEKHIPKIYFNTKIVIRKTSKFKLS